MVVYQALYGERGHWVRSLADFTAHVSRDGYEGPRFAAAAEGGEWLTQRLAGARVRCCVSPARPPTARRASVMPTSSPRQRAFPLQALAGDVVERVTRFRTARMMRRLTSRPSSRSGAATKVDSSTVVNTIENAPPRPPSAVANPNDRECEQYWWLCVA